MDRRHSRGKLLLPLYASKSVSVEDLFKKRDVVTLNKSTISLATVTTPYLQRPFSQRGVSPRCKPNHHYARVVANVLADCPIDKPITPPRVYADTEPCFILVSDIGTEEELRHLINTKYGTRFEAKDIFRLPSKFFEAGQGDTTENSKTDESPNAVGHQCENVDNLTVLPIFSEKYKTHARKPNENLPKRSKHLTKFHLHGKNARIETEYEYEYEPEYLIEFDIMENGEIKYKADKTGKPIYFLDSSRNKVVKKDKDGNTIYKVNAGGKRIPLKDEAGKFVFKLDETGQKILRRDEMGSPVFNIRMATKSTVKNANNNRNGQQMTKFPPASMTQSKLKPTNGERPKTSAGIYKPNILITKKFVLRKLGAKKTKNELKGKDIFDEYRILDGEESQATLNSESKKSKKSVKTTNRKSIDNIGFGDEPTKFYRMDGGGDTGTPFHKKENAQLKVINRQLKIKLKELTEKLETKKRSKISKTSKRVDGSGDFKQEDKPIKKEAEAELKHCYKTIRNVIKKQANIAKELGYIKVQNPNEFKPHLKQKSKSPVKVSSSTQGSGGSNSYRILNPQFPVDFQSHGPVAESSSPKVIPLRLKRNEQKKHSKSARNANVEENVFIPAPSSSQPPVASCRNSKLTSTMSKESSKLQKPQETVLTPTISDIMLIVQTLYPRQSWVKGNAVAVRYYPNGKVFCSSYSNGSGQVFYPHGGLALIVSAPNPVNQVLVIRDPEDEFFLPDKAILADFDTVHGTGLVSTTEGMGKQKFNLHYDQNFGHIDGTTKIQKRWSWRQGGTRLTLKINRYFSLRVMNLNQIHLIFNGNQRGVRINVGKSEFPIVLQTVRGGRNENSVKEKYTTHQLQRDKSKYSSPAHDMKSNLWNYVHGTTLGKSSSEVGIPRSRLLTTKLNYNFAIAGNVRKGNQTVLFKPCLTNLK